MQYPLQLIPIKENLSLFLPIPEEIRTAYGETLPFLGKGLAFVKGNDGIPGRTGRVVCR